MNKDLLNIICCPECKGVLALKNAVEENSKIKSGLLSCVCGNAYKVVDFIPRFVDTDKYVGSFSFEWTTHRHTQLDSASRLGISESDFRKRIDFPIEDLKNKLVLDVGCGMGRFSEIALKYGSRLIGIDLSFAVDAAYKNLGSNPNVDFVQADIFKLPFRENTFDLIYSFGVLHHTPDCRAAFLKLPPLLKKGGKVSIFVYASYNKAIVYSSAFWRFFTTRFPKRLLHWISYISVPLYYIYKIPVIGNIGKMIFVIPMWKDWRWRVLDTFDWYSPKYQSKHTHWEVFGWFKDAGLKDAQVYEGEITMSGTKQ